MAEKKTTQLTIQSIVFSNGGHITPRYTCEGEDINPQLEIIGTPENAASLALIVEDPDAPNGMFYHWLLWNLHPHTKVINEQENAGISGTNSFGNTGYGGPCPPSGEHRYFFRVYALDTKLDLAPGADIESLKAAMQDHVIGEGELMGLYKKHS